MHNHDDERLTDTELGVAVAATAGGMIAAATILVCPPLWPLGWLILARQGARLMDGGRR